MNLSDYPAVRRVLYVVSFIVGLVLGGCQVGFASADASQPTWLTVALAVYAFAGAYLGITAATNTPRAG